MGNNFWHFYWESFLDTKDKARKTRMFILIGLFNCCSKTPSALYKRSTNFFWIVWARSWVISSENFQIVYDKFLQWGLQKYPRTLQNIKYIQHNTIKKMQCRVVVDSWIWYHCRPLYFANNANYKKVSTTVNFSRQIHKTDLLFTTSCSARHRNPWALSGSKKCKKCDKLQFNFADNAKEPKREIPANWYFTFHGESCFSKREVKEGRIM